MIDAELSRGSTERRCLTPSDGRETTHTDDSEALDSDVIQKICSMNTHIKTVVGPNASSLVRTAQQTEQTVENYKFPSYPKLISNSFVERSRNTTTSFRHCCIFLQN